MQRLACLAAILLATAVVTASPAPELVVQAPPELARAAAGVEALADGDFSAALTLNGLTDFGGPIQVVLAPEGSRLARMAPPWAAGYSVGERSLVVLIPSRTPSYPDRNAEALLHHEVTHVLTHRAVAGRPLPRWLVEGLATVAAREWGLEDRARSSLALIGRGPESLAEVDRAFAGDSRQAARAYALSAALVRSILGRHGPDATARTLAEVRRGSDIAAAYRRATGESLAELETRFFEEDAFWFTWVPFVTSTTVVWIAITFLAIIAIRHRRRRSAEIHARWEAEEQSEAARVLRFRPSEDHDEIVN